MSQPKPTLAQQQQAIQSQLLELYVKKADLEEQLEATVKSIRELRTVLAGMQVAANAAPELPPAAHSEPPSSAAAPQETI